MDLGNELRTGHVSIDSFSTSLRQCLLPLRHIQLNKGVGSGSFGAEPAGADIILFHMEGRLLFRPRIG